jgi:hypothetical protein
MYKKRFLKPPVNPPIYTEDQEATALASYLRALELEGSIDIYSHIYHEGNLSKRQRGIKARLGTRKGVPDYIIVTPTELIFIELKRRGFTPSDLAEEQILWLTALEGKTATTAVCGGFMEAKLYLKARGIELKNQYLWVD